jgi:hypothetical protein
MPQDWDDVVGARERRDPLGTAPLLRVNKGGLNLTLPTVYDYTTQTGTFGISRITLTPEGHELNVEIAYSLPFAGGSLCTNFYWRIEPGTLPLRQMILAAQYGLVLDLIQ